jgi:tetratricopeptide (TPR) repeat protein
MAEDILDAQNSAEEASQANASAVALALDGASSRPELSAAIAAFLKEQRRLMQEQREQLRDQVKRMRLGIIDQRFSIALKAMTAAVGVAVAVFFAVMVWSAYGSGGLTIEPFSVPPELAARGLTSEVVAAKLLDQLSQMQAETTSQRAPQSFQNYWGQDIKVMIPDTGISLGELDRYLNLKLGHATRVSGEVVRTAADVAVTARSGTSGSVTASGNENALDPLMHDLAEQVYRLTQPYLYGVWLLKKGRTKEALPVYVALATGGPIEERGWGYLGWSNTLQVLEGETSRLAMLARGVEADPHLFIIRQNIALSEDEMGRPEKAIADGRKALAALATPDNGGIRADVAPYSRDRIQCFIDADSGDYRSAAARLMNNFKSGAGIFTYSVAGLVARSFAGEHDLKRARFAAVLNWRDTGFNLSIKDVDDLSAQMFIAAQSGDWRDIVALNAKAGDMLAKLPALHDLLSARIVPFVAMARAMLGDFKKADALIAGTPDHCDLCLRTRARIAELEQQYGRMDWWFARAVAQNPSIPFAYTDWGQTLMANGDLAGAAAKFEIAHQKAPRFADPLEMWGEVLIRQNRSDLALAKFQEASRYAPNWGRLHLKWGEALSWAGKHDGAKRQFARAGELDLTASEKSELAKVSHG